MTPEDGVNRYEYDLTQGPACAIAAGAGTIYRNYFAPVNGKIGQTADNQIDCLAEMGAALENSKNQLWQMKNGYALPSLEGLDAINNQIISASELERDELRKLLRIGIQWNTEVTLNEAKHTVTQAYCSALPVSYSNLPAKLWAEFAKLILEAAYEATFCAGILNQLNTGNNKIYLTLLGGGAFGNNQEWIINAIARSLELYKSFDLNVFIVSYRYSHPHIQQLISEYQA
ncbi:hypothetical protein [Thiofilum flexile]|uniref:hypothetical protein n=1 Tax=Thiofilum flexile TaxID=125627 RepID=UPI001B7FE206|nr:hypothetical protein [Thiofilum flexile]